MKFVHYLVSALFVVIAGVLFYFAALDPSKYGGLVVVGLGMFAVGACNAYYTYTHN